MSLQSMDPRPGDLSSLAGTPVVDADTHLSEWYDLWTSRAPARLKDRVPQVRKINDRYEWFIDGQLLNREGASSAIRRDGSKAYGMDFKALQLADVHAGAYDVRARIEFMDQQGVAAQIAYPNLLGFGGQKSMRLEPEVRNASVQIFNDAMAELQADSGNRIYPMAMMPWWDANLSVKEAERCAAMGLRGVNMNSDPHEHGLPDLGDAHYTPLWEVCVDKGLPVNFHIGASDDSMTWFARGLWPGHPDGVRLAYGSLMLFVGNMRVLSNIILSGFLDRHPDLKIVSVESGVGWIPFVLEGLEYQMHEAAMKYRRSPQEVFQQQIYACCWFERQSLLQTIRSIGADNVMFETDFPHPTCLYPGAAEYVRDAAEQMTADERRKIFGGTAEALYRLDLSAWKSKRH